MTNRIDIGDGRYIQSRPLQPHVVWEEPPKLTLICRTHALEEEGIAGPVEYRPITVESGAWICSGVLLYNCTVGAGSIVSAGTVLRSQVVGPGVMVAGNPARVIARLQDGKWLYLPGEFQRRLE